MELARDDIIVSLTYFVIAFCIVFPPAEFVNAGITVQTIYAGWLGSEQLDFVNYHIRRTVATMVVHSALPLGYFLALALFSPSHSIRSFIYFYFMSNDGALAWPFVGVLMASIIVFMAALSLGRTWLKGNHPIIRQLKLYSPNWKRIAAEISTEMLRIDKFEAGPPTRRLIITDSWVLLTTTYNVYLAKKVDIRLRLKGAIDMGSHPEFGQHGVQFLDIEVIDIGHSTSEQILFSVRLSSFEYTELQLRVNSPIENVRNIVIRQSLSDQFVAAFLEQIENNPRYRLPSDQPEPEKCIGCMQATANVKLERLCGDDRSGNEEHGCQQCYCRPMWCAECLGRWFAARQQQEDPSTWMTHKCPCPTCRSVFCVLDICKVDT